MQDGFTPAYVASESGHTETVALLLWNKADINAATKVQQLKIFNHLYTSLIKLLFNDFST
jgi:hypothetical protein